MIKKVLHIILFICTASAVWAQGIGPAGNTGWDHSHVITSTQTGFAAVNVMTDRSYSLDLWDRGGWYTSVAISDLPLHGSNPEGDFEVQDVIEFDGKIFVAGKYVIKIGGSNRNYVLAWDGSSWTDYDQNIVSQSADILKFITLNNELYLAGSFGSSAITSNLLKLDNGTWVEHGDLLTGDPSSDYINDAYAYDGKIFMSGGFTFPKLTGKRILASLNSGTWTVEQLVPFQTGAANFGLYKGAMVLFGDPIISNYDYFKTKQNSTWTNISNGLDGIDVQNVNRIQQVGNDLWVTGKMVRQSDNKVYSIMRFDGSAWSLTDLSEVSNDLHIVRYDNSGYLFGNYQIGEIVNFGKIFADHALLSGNIFHDFNSNCALDAGDQGMGLGAIELLPLGMTFPISSDGSFAIPVEQGEYTVRLVEPIYWTTTCNNEFTVTVDNLTNYDQLNFGVSPEPNKVDVVGSITDFRGWLLEKGAEDQIQFCVRNLGTEDAKNVKATLFLDKNITQIQYSQIPDSEAEDEVSWTFDLEAGGEKCFTLTLNIPSDIGNEVEYRYELDLGDGSDENTNNNSGQTSFKTGTGEVPPLYKSLQNGEVIDMEAETLSYKIRFENTGNSLVDRVVVHDTFDEDIYIDWLSFNYSFDKSPKRDAEYIIVGDNYQWVYTWTFEDVVLPDSATDKLGAIGFLDVSIGLYDNKHPKGTEICNQAMVQMNNNEPGYTNEVCAKFGESIGYDDIDLARLSVYPNPAAHIVVIDNPTADILDVQITNLAGQVIRVVQIRAFEELEVNLSELSDGVYLLSAPGYSATRLMKTSY